MNQNTPTPQSDPLAHVLPDENPLEPFCLRHSLVLLEALAHWRQENPGDSFEQLLLRHHDQIREDRWLETMAAQTDFPIPLPLGKDSEPAPANARPDARVLRDNLFTLILQDDPVMVFGLLNPFLLPAVEQWGSLHHPIQPQAFVLLTPSIFASLAAKESPNSSHNWRDEPLPEWNSQMPFNSPDISFLVESLWTSNPCLPVLSRRDMDIVQPIESIENALLVRQTDTHAWIIGVAVHSRRIHDELCQRLGRRVIPLACGPRTFHELRKQTESDIVRPNPAGNQPLVIHRWQIPPGQPPETALLDQIVETAIRFGATDIHLDPKDERTRVRFRIAGNLVEQAPLNKSDFALALRRIKITGRGMRQDRSGCPQDGASHHWVDNRRYDMRFSLVPLSGGEEGAVIRLFTAAVPKLSDLHFDELENRALRHFLGQESGLLILSGPTGSGKTTTLYACLQALSQPGLKLVSIENPVEKRFEDAVQIEVEGDTGLSYPDALRSVLRQDPDVLMVGEIRDAESARIALQAALTGHQVLTTLHAMDSVGVVTRLCDSFQIDPAVLACCLRLSIAQRLVRILCPLCKQTRPADPESIRPFPEIRIADPVLAEKKGCPACRHTGYAGRRALLELLPVDTAMTALIQRRAPDDDLRAHNRQHGYRPLLEQASTLLLTGEIDLPEASSFLHG
ncbi:MAG: GspE/PulE family protein [Verrucomicrobiae bacterium]|nr:GspE/PulE family protein [Verrucomicrobiae bacterium]